MSIHKRILGTVYIVLGTCLIFFFLLCTILFRDILPLIGEEFMHEREFLIISQLFPYVLGFILLPVSILSIIGGIGVLRGKAWGLTLLLVMGILFLVCWPVGTIVGIYAILIYADENKSKGAISSTAS